MKNVIIFPKEMKDSPPRTVEDVLEVAEENQKEAVETAIDMVMPMLLAELSKYNLFVDDEKDIGMIMESIKSGVYRTIGLEHELQNVTDRLINIL